MSWDPCLDLASGVLRDRLGITDRAELARAGSELTGSRLVDLERTDLPGAYDLPHLQAFHRHILGRPRLGGRAARRRHRQGPAVLPAAAAARPRRPVVRPAHPRRPARAAGFRLRWAGTDPTENVEASRAAPLDGDRGRLRLLLDGVLTTAA